MEFLDLAPLLSAQGTVRLPGSKSISNRVLLLAALSSGVTEVRDLLASDDTERMLEALTQLGVGVESLGNDAYRVTGTGGRAFPVQAAELFLGNAGTAFRPLTAALALAGGHYTLKGVPRKGDPARLVASSERIRRELGWQLRHDDIGDIIASAWEWHRSHPQGYAD